MASSLTVKVHPVVYLTIVDAYERRVRPSSKNQADNDKALGTLMGFYEKGGIQITNCFAIPFNDNRDEPELDDSYNQSMIQIMKRSTPTEQPVGWFYTSSDLGASCIPYHDYFVRVIGEVFGPRKEVPPVVLLTLDTTFTAPDDKFRIQARAYIRTKAGIPGNRDPHCAIFHPLRVEMDAFPGECVALNLIQGAVDNKAREVELDTGLGQLEKSTGQIMQWLERLLQYVDEVLARDELPADATIGRKLMDIVQTAASHMQQEKLENLVKNSLRDYVMISYLANLTKAQLALHERAVTL